MIRKARKIQFHELFSSVEDNYPSGRKISYKPGSRTASTRYELSYAAVGSLNYGKTWHTAHTRRVSRPCELSYESEGLLA
jgi:hypothetical protein